MKKTTARTRWGVAMTFVLVPSIASAQHHAGFVPHAATAPRFVVAPHVVPTVARPVRPVVAPRPMVGPVPVTAVPARPVVAPRLVPAPTVVVRAPVITQPPPAVRVDTPQGAPPRPGAQWRRGYWGWGGDHYGWVAGRWAFPPHPGVVWVGDQWIVVNGSYAFVPGYWRDDSGPVFAAGPTTPLELGTAIEGALGPGDMQLANGAFADDYVVTLSAGRGVTAVARGTTAPMAVQVYLAGQLVTQTAAPPDGTDSVVAFVATESGPYVIRVTTWGPGPQSGSYSLWTAPTSGR